MLRPWPGWRLVEHTCEDDSGWLLRRADDWEIKWGKYRRRMRWLRAVHPLRARRWEQQGTTISLLVGHWRGYQPASYDLGGVLAAYLPLLYDSVFTTKPMLFMLSEERETDAVDQ